MFKMFRRPTVTIVQAAMPAPHGVRVGDYRDFIPNRYRATRAEQTPKRAGELILNSSGPVLQVQRNGDAIPWKRPGY